MTADATPVAATYTKKQEQQTARRLRALASQWITIFGLDHWDISIRLTDQMPEVGFQLDEEAYSVYATCHPNWPYQSATLAFNASKAVTFDDDALLELLVHELTHCSLDEMKFYDTSESGLAHLEHCASAVSAAILRAYEAGCQKGFKEARAAPQD